MKHPGLLPSLCLFLALGCDTEDATQIVVDNEYPQLADGGNSSSEMTVYKVWWVASLLPDAVAPGSEGEPQRTVPGTDFSYAVLAPGWDPSAGTGPSRFLAMKSNVRLSAARGDTLHVRVSDDTFSGNCGAGKPLSQDDADFITQRIFPGEFAGVVYDAVTCIGTSVGRDAGVTVADAAGNAVEPDAMGPGDGAAE